MPTFLLVYRLPSGRWSLESAEGATEHAVELADGWQVTQGFYDGRPMIAGPPGELGLDAEEAIRRGVLRVLEGIRQ